ncbi:ABC transporter permease [Varibaculum cambriense]|uniref:ABC transporter permease n=1 Tax=Varibaculum cambriense TaxID=184870 RepID=UPI002903AA44|nr:ABC transporter permease [Varibaculum cambriense]MDU1223740.1 ABC transporter permease [Varibaculum cambriense]
MSFAGRAWRYVVRKPVRTIVIFAVLTLVATVLMSADAIERASARESAKVAAKAGAGFVLENNPQFNQGTPRGAGTVKPADIAQIAKLPEVKSYVARQNVTADLVGAQTQKLGTNDYDEKKEAQFGNAVNVWGVNRTDIDNNFRSGALTLAAGRHLRPGDHHKAIIHEDLAKANGLKLGSKLKLKGNPYDVDNMRQSTTETEMEIVGLVRGSNTRQAAQRSELFSNTVYTDLDTTRALYQMSKDNEIYQDANFFVASEKDLEQVEKKAGSLKIDWRNYQLSPATQYLAGITGALSGINSLMSTTKMVAFGFALLILTLVLFLWMNERKKETGVLLSVGTSKASIFAQYLCELVITAIPAFVLAFFISGAVAQWLGNSALASVNSSLMQELAQAGQAGADMESSAATKTLDALAVSLSTPSVITAVSLTLLVGLLCVLAASFPMLRRPPRALLVDIK